MIEIGRVYWTEGRKGGPVKVLALHPFFGEDQPPYVVPVVDTAWVEYVTDHPEGYAQGERSWRDVDELREMTRSEASELPAGGGSIPAA